MKLGDHIHKVLVIDDDPIFTEVLRAFFEGRGTKHVVTASDGKEAMSALAAHASSLDLISSDLNMPNFDGVEFITHLKNQNAKVPLVLVSSADSKIVHAASKLAEAYGLQLMGSLPKPLDVKALEALLQPLITD